VVVELAKFLKTGSDAKEAEVVEEAPRPAGLGHA